MSGFPHSEICGSKVAHTSPQLIAACHVLHRLYAPRHPRIALTSRLRARTTNNSTAAEPLGNTLHGHPSKYYFDGNRMRVDDRLATNSAEELSRLLGAG
jgi:hypothetical protein